MNERTYTIHGRRGRVFGPDEAIEGEPNSFAAGYMTSDDIPRDKLLTRLLHGETMVTAVAYPAVECNGQFHVYLSGYKSQWPAFGVFACVVVSRRRLAALLEGMPVVMESFTLQVADVDDLGEAGIAMAVWEWLRRNYLLAPAVHLLVRGTGARPRRRHRKRRIVESLVEFKPRSNLVPRVKQAA